MGAAPFGQKLELVLKILSISRGRLAADLGIDKSVVNRWARGVSAPTAHNLTALTSLIASRQPGFTLLDWERELGDLAAMFGASIPSAETPSAVDDILGVSRAQSRIEVGRDGDAYPGVFVGYRQAFGNSGRIIPDLIVFFRQGESLFFTIHDPVFSHRGEVFILRHQLFMFGEDGQRADGLTLHVLNGVVGRKAVRLDGLLLSVYGDRYRTPTAAAVVMHRLMDLEDPSVPPSAEALTAILIRLQALYEVDELAALAGPRVVAAVTPLVGAPSPLGGFDHLLRAPAERSLSASETDWNLALEVDTRRLRRAVLGLDDCYEVFVARPGPTSPRA